MHAGSLSASAKWCWVLSISLLIFSSFTEMDVDMYREFTLTFVVQLSAHLY